MHKSLTNYNKIKNYSYSNTIKIKKNIPNHPNYSYRFTEMPINKLKEKNFLNDDEINDELIVRESSKSKKHNFGTKSMNFFTNNEENYTDSVIIFLLFL